MFDEIRFDLNLVVAGDDGEHVAIVYQSPMTLTDGTELTHRQYGDLPCRRRPITEVWNCGYKQECGSDCRRTRVDDRVLDELGYYLLAGAGGEGPATLMDEARRGEELGFGTAFISERWNVKEASSLVRAACGHQPDADRDGRNQSQHPPSADHRIVGHHHAPVSGGRFTLGSGADRRHLPAFGIPAVTTAQMEDFAR